VFISFIILPELNGVTLVHFHESVQMNQMKSALRWFI